MGPTGDGPQVQLAYLAPAFQQGKFRPGGLPVRPNFPQQTGQGLPGDGGVNNAGRFRRTAVDPGVIALFHGPGGVQFVHQRMDVRIFCRQHDAEGVPVQPGHGMEGAVLAGFGIISLDPVGQSAGDDGPGGVNEHPGGLVHCQQEIILVQQGQGPVLCRIVRLRGVQQQRHRVPGLNGEVRVPALAVDQNTVLPFQPVHQPRGNVHFRLQNVGQPPGGAGNVI